MSRATVKQIVLLHPQLNYSFNLGNILGLSGNLLKRADQALIFYRDAQKLNSQVEQIKLIVFRELLDIASDHNQY